MSQRHPSNPRKAVADFEMRSDCSIRNCGTWRYSLDPTTEVLCLAYRLPHWAPGRTGLWHPAFPQFDIDECELSDSTAFDDLAELFDWIRSGNLIEAHNAWFERGIWQNKMLPSGRGWPRITPEQWRCSAAKAASHSLPRALDKAADALELPITKDAEGSKVMKKMAKPRKPIKRDKMQWARDHAPCRWCDGSGKLAATKKDGSPTAKPAKCPMCGGGGHTDASLPPMPMLWHESVDMLFQLFDYCRVDVLAEEGLSDRLPDLSLSETQIYLLDQKANETGFQLDREGIEAALAVIDEECADLNKELFELTDGAVEKATQRIKMLDWLGDQGLELDDTKAETLDDVLDTADTWAVPPTEQAIRGLELMRTLGRSSTAKYVAAANWICPDDRAHGGLLYHAAGTGRWGGQGIQPQNFPKGGIKDIEAAWKVIKTRDREAIKAFPKNKEGEPYNDVMEMLSHALRGIIVAPEGCELFVADYAAIEARVLLWLAEDDEALDVFNQPHCPCRTPDPEERCSLCDVYLSMATSIFGGHLFKSKAKFERSIGKIAVLGLGYQMGASKFVDTAARGDVEMLEDAPCAVCDEYLADHRKADHDYELPPDVRLTGKTIVTAYREKFWRVVALWKELEETAIQAVRNGPHASPERCGRISYYVEDGFLYGVLPSGRRLAYPNPEVRMRETPWGEMRPQLTFEGVNPLNKQWGRQAAYGGLLCENNVQAIARDLMAAAYLRCDRSKTYTPVLTVHDELIAWAKIGTGNVKEFEALMAENPRWATGCPVEAEGWSGFRYRK